MIGQLLIMNKSMKIYDTITTFFERSFSLYKDLRICFIGMNSI